MEQMHLNIVEARMNQVGPYAMLGNFVVTGTEGFKPSQTEIANYLSESLKDPENFDKVIRRRGTAATKTLLFPTEVTFSNDTASKRTVMEVVTPDRPGLLAKFALILLDHNVEWPTPVSPHAGRARRGRFPAHRHKRSPTRDVGLCQRLSDSLCSQLDNLNMQESSTGKLNPSPKTAHRLDCNPMNPDLDRHNPDPFEILAKLNAGVIPPAHLKPISLSIGEPKIRHLPCTGGSRYNYNDWRITPTTKGLPELRQSIARWLERRFKLTGGVDPESQVLPVNGTREPCLPSHRPHWTAAPSPSSYTRIRFIRFTMRGHVTGREESPYLLNCSPENGYLPDFDTVPEAIWNRCQLLYVCSPGNPSGAIIPMETLPEAAATVADTFDFIIASDECYSEIYQDENAPPVGLLRPVPSADAMISVAASSFHSLSKRSNVPGMRSGFVAGDEI